jgi:hypothetical protein
MRILVSTLMALWLAVLPTTALAAEPDFAARVEGFIGYTNLEVFNSDEDAFQGGGTGSASVVFDRIYLQGDIFGNVMEFDEEDFESVGAGAHFGWRDPERGSAGLVGNYTDLNDGTDVGRAGFEGELFFDRLSLAANIGYLGIESDDFGYADAGVAFYPVDRARLYFRGGVFGFDDNDPFGLLGAGGEFLFLDMLSAFTRWEAAFYDDSGLEIEQHSIVFGVTLYWGSDEPSLRSYDRTHFKPSCGGYLLVGRIC